MEAVGPRQHLGGNECRRYHSGGEPQTDVLPRVRGRISKPMGLQCTREQSEDCGSGKRKRAVAVKLRRLCDLAANAANVNERSIEIGHEE